MQADNRPQTLRGFLNKSFTNYSDGDETALLMKSLLDFSDLLKYYGYNVPAASESSLEKLLDIPEVKKRQIRQYFENWTTWIQPENSSERVLSTNIRTEILFAKRALKHYGLMAHDSFWTTLEAGHVIEIYGEDMIQLYRSLSFFKYCGYSLLDISINEWFVLWERPKRVIEAMGKHVEQVLTTDTPTVKMDVPRHVLREMLNTGDTTPFIPRACLVDFQQIGSLKKSPLARPSAFIVSASGEVIATGSDALNIAFV